MIWLSPLATVALASLTAALGWRRFGPLVASLRAAAPEDRSGQLGQRLRGVLEYVLGQRRLLTWPFSGIAHFLIFWGFLILNLEILQAGLEALVRRSTWTSSTGGARSPSSRTFWPWRCWWG